MSKIRLAMALHNHQPVGNFDGVIDASYVDSYLPFLEVVEKYPQFPFSLHTSGCLMEWLVAKKPDYVARLKKLVERGQVEILGGGFYEPILPMIPPRDRVGQIRGYTEYLREIFGCQVRGMWTPERVWEQTLVKDIANSGIEYTILDDYHFRKAGLKSEDLFGYYASEDDGHVIRIFPGSEPLRYMIPFRDIGEIIGYLRAVRDRHPNALCLFADDGEKFGAWPHTKAHVYQYGWIYRFLDALRDNASWIEVCTIAQALDDLPPKGRIYLPDCSYREMTEWALPADQFVEYEKLSKSLDHHANGAAVREFMKGGYWRNFKVRYPETNEMYARMMEISQRIDRLCTDSPEAFGNHQVHQARHELYRAQCNCSYWHGSFGGLYLPHLRNAVFEHLIKADNLLNSFERGGDARFVTAELKDFNFDAQPEVKIDNDQMVVYVAPDQGGVIYELDVRSIAVNLGASLARRPESYHEKIRQTQGHNNAHQNVVVKQEGLDRRIAYDNYARKSLIDHFFDEHIDPSGLRSNQVPERGDFVSAGYRATLNQTEDHAVVALSRSGTGNDSQLTIAKTIAVTAGSNTVVVRYRIENQTRNRPLHFAVEFNFAALAAGADDRYFLAADRRRLGRLSSLLSLDAAPRLSLVDEWLGIETAVSFSKPAGIWTFPIESVSQSEGGFELVHQSACVMPHWHIPASDGIWEVEISLALDTSAAEARRKSAAHAAH